MDVIVGADPTVNQNDVLDKPPTVTNTLPVVAVAGTGTVIWLELQLVGVAAVPLKLTVLAPCVAPKFNPVIVTDVPAAAKPGVMVVIEGLTVKLRALLGTPPTVTTTGPLVAFAGTVREIEVAVQELGLTSSPLMVTRLLP